MVAQKKGVSCHFVLNLCQCRHALHALTTAYSKEFYKLTDLQIDFSSDPTPFTTKMPIFLCNDVLSRPR